MFPLRPNEYFCLASEHSSESRLTIHYVVCVCVGVCVGGGVCGGVCVCVSVCDNFLLTAFLKFGMGHWDETSWVVAG